MKPILLTALVLPLLLRAADWPCLSGPTLDFHADATGIGRDWQAHPPALLWKVAMSDDGHACASCVSGHLFIVDHVGSNDVVRALALADGRELWRTAYLDLLPNYYGHARATPTFDDGRIYTLSQGGLVHCLDAATGKILWRTDYTSDYGGVRPRHNFCAPIGVWHNLAYLQPGGTNGSVVAVDKATGAFVWRGGARENCGYSLPIVVAFDGVPTLLCHSANALMGLDPATGVTRWSFPRPHPYGNNVIQPLVMGNRIFTGATDFAGSSLIEIRDGQPHEVWKSGDFCPVCTTPVLASNALFGTASGKPAKPEGLMCVDASSGKILWKVNAFEHGQVLAVDGVVLALDGVKGDLVMFEPTTEAYREITRFTPLGGRSWATFFTIGDRLILRNTKTLACFKLGDGR